MYLAFPKQLKPKMSKKDLVLGVDIGGTNSAFGFVDKRGECILDSSIPTLPQNSAEDLFDRLHKKVNAIFKSISNDYNLIGIGIGAPNANYYKGTVELPPNLNWGIVNVKEIVKLYYD